LDKLIYLVARFIYIFSALFFFPVMAYSVVNEWLFGLIVLMGLGGGWGFGWIFQDMYEPTPPPLPGEENVDHLFF
jgi:hypothetical protein